MHQQQTAFENIEGKGEIARNEQFLLSQNVFYSIRYLYPQFSFLAALAEGQRVIVMALCPSCVCVCMRPSVCPSVHACVRKLFLQKTSPQKPLTGFLRNFTGMFLRWSSFKFLQIIMFFEEFWLPW